MYQTASRKKAGPMKGRAGPQRFQSVRRGGGGAAAGACPATLALVEVILASPASCLLVGLGRRRLELLRRPVHIVALEELLQERELGVAPERGRSEIGHVEEEVVGVRKGGREALRDLVRIDVLADVLVRRGEAASLRPDLARLGRGEILDERLGSRTVLEHDHFVAAADDDLARVTDLREVEEVVV